MIAKYLSLAVWDTDETFLDQVSDLMHRHAMLIVLVTGVLFNTYEAYFPPPLFSSSGERESFFTDVHLQPSRVIALISDTCSACPHLVQDLEKSRIHFTAVNIDTAASARRLFETCSKRSGESSLPQVVVDSQVSPRSVAAIRHALRR